MGPTADTPWLRPYHKSSTLWPCGLIVPMPVTTTRLRGLVSKARPYPLSGGILSLRAILVPSESKAVLRGMRAGRRKRVDTKEPQHSRSAADHATAGKVAGDRTTSLLPGELCVRLRAHTGL